MDLESLSKVMTGEEEIPVYFPDMELMTIDEFMPLASQAC